MENKKLRIKDEGIAADDRVKNAMVAGTGLLYPSVGRRLLIGTAVVLVALGSGCQEPARKIVTHPEGTLRVPYEVASAPSSCLVASVTMAANYLEGQRRFKEPAVRVALKQQKLDETKVTDLRTYLTGQGLDLIAVSGELDGKPPLGLKFWSVTKGYPVICVINQHEGDPQFNHAVVVTGFSANADKPLADIVYYLDPATRDPLQSVGLWEFDTWWGRCGRAMMVVVKPPPGQGNASQPAPGK